MKQDARCTRCYRRLNEPPRNLTPIVLADLPEGVYAPAVCRPCVSELSKVAYVP